MPYLVVRGHSASVHKSALESTYSKADYITDLVKIALWVGAFKSRRQNTYVATGNFL